MLDRSYDYTSLRREGYAHTYALVNYVTAEVYTSSCDLPEPPLRRLLRKMDGIRRECRGEGSPCVLVLANCTMGEVLAEVSCDFGIDRIGHLYEMMEGKGR